MKAKMLSELIDQISPVRVGDSRRIVGEEDKGWGASGDLGDIG